MKVFPEKYWTIEELKELIVAIDQSEYGRNPVMYRGQLVWFLGRATFTFSPGSDVATVDDLEIRSA